MTVRNEIKAQIVRAGYTMQEVVDRLHEEYDWSDSVSNLSAKLQRESIRYKEVVELADRAVTMFQGRINHEFKKDEITQDNLMAASFGVYHEGADEKIAS